MKRIIIDCTQVNTPRQLHQRFAQALELPEWYGYNLDALHDLLMELSRDTVLILRRYTCLPPFFRGFLRVLGDAERENPYLYVILIDEAHQTKE